MLKADDRLYFIHIPKTAGTTLTPLIDMHFHAREICPAQLWRELVHLPQEDLPNYRLFRGHFGGNGLNSFLPKPPVTMTMLRHPLPLTVSTYKFILREPGTRVHQLVKRNNMSLADFLDCRKTRNKASDKQVRHLSFDLEHDADSGPIFHHHESLAAIDRWVRDHRKRIDPELRLERAKAKLRECAFFGLVERFEESMHLMSWSFGWPPIGPVQKLMVAPSGKSKNDEVSDDLRARIMRYNRLDGELYTWAESLFDERLQEMKADLAQYKEHPSRSNGTVATVTDSEIYQLLDRRYAALRAERSEPKRERMRLSLEEPLWGDGWHRREDSALDGTCFRWTGPARRSTMDVKVNVAQDARVTVCLINAVNDDVMQSFKLYANGAPVELDEVAGKARGRVLQGIVSADDLQRHPAFLRLTFEVGETAALKDHHAGNPDDRHVGVAVNWVDIAPASQTQAGQMPEIEITDAERQVLRDRRRGAMVRQLKQRIAAIPVVGPNLKRAYVKMKNR